MRSQINIEKIDKESNKRNQINMIHKKVSDERNQIDDNDEDISTNDIEILKVGTLCSKENINNIERTKIVRILLTQL